MTRWSVTLAELEELAQQEHEEAIRILAEERNENEEDMDEMRTVSLLMMYVSEGAMDCHVLVLFFIWCCGGGMSCDVYFHH